MIKLVKSTFYNEQETKKKLADFIIQTDILSMGKEVKKFEENFAKKQQRQFAVFVNSGSSANLVLLQSLLNTGRLKKGDRIGISAVTWATNVMPVIQLGFIPVAIDCELDTLNVSPNTLEKQIQNINALFITNVLGMADDLVGIQEMCRKHKVLLLEDNCESLGSKIGSTLLGNFGLASTFSFYVGHHLSTIEGGMVCTDDREMYEALIMCRAHGWSRNLSKERQKEFEKKLGSESFFGLYTFYDLAYNVRPTEIQGFLGNDQLRYWDTIVSAREKNYREFEQTIKNNTDILPLRTKHIKVFSNFAVPLIFKTKAAFNKYRNAFEKAGVEIRPIIAGNMVRQPFYRKYVVSPEECKNADHVHVLGFYFGNNPELTPEEIKLIKGLVK